MRRFLFALNLLLFAVCRLGAFTVTNEVDGTVDWSSYDSAQYTAPSYILGGSYYATYFYNAYPQYTNHIYSVAESGATWQDTYQHNEEAFYIPMWNSFAVPGYDWMLVSDNGGYDSNSVIQWGTNIFSYPPLSYNGTASTNENIPCAGLSHVALGCIPDASQVPASLAWLRNNASTNLDAIYGAPIIDLNGVLRTNGYYTNALFGYYTGGHPYAAGSLIMALEMLLAQGVETNIGAITLDWNNQVVSATNHATVINSSFANNNLTFTARFDRMPMAWDDGTEGWDARDAFTIAPVLGNAFQWTLQVTNLPGGNYIVNIDGSNVVTLSSSQLGVGWNMFTNYNGALWAHRMAVLNAKFDQVGVDHFTRVAHSAGDYGTIRNTGDMVNFGSAASGIYPTRRGTNYIAAMAVWVGGVKQYDVLIHNAAIQTNHVFTISPAGQPQTITFPTPGDQVYGVAPVALGATASSGLAVTYTVTSGPATVSGNSLTITNIGSVTIQASQSGNSTWLAATPVSQTIFVSPKTLIPSVTASDKIYDGTATASIAARNVSGIVGTDVVALTGGVAQFPDKTVGAGRTVTVTNLSLSGTDAGKYILLSSNATTTASITPRSLTVTGIISADKPYDGTVTATINASGATLAGVIGGDVVFLSGTASGAFADATVGAGKTVTISGLSLGGADVANYSLVQPTSTASITKATTALALTSSLSLAPPGSNVIFTATLSVGPPGAGMPAGSLLLKDGATYLGTNALNYLDPSLFAFNSLSHGSHTISAEYRGDGNFLGSTNSLNQIIDAPPVAGSALLQRYATSGVKIRASDLLTNDTDPDGDVLSLLSVATTTPAGGVILTNAGWISYQPPDGFTNSDCFTRIIADSFGLQSTGLVRIVVSADTNTAQNIARLGGIIPKNAPLLFSGIPKRVYTIQYTTNPSSPNWQTLGTAGADDTGLIQFFDDPPPDSLPRFYRTTYP